MHVTPTNFIHTLLFIAILTIPFLLVISGGAILGLSFGMSLVIFIPMPTSLKKWLFAGTLPESTMQYALVTRIFQVTFYMLIGSTALNLGHRASKWYEEKISNLIPAFVYDFDMYEGRECRLEEGYKLTPLGDTKFLLAKNYPLEKFNSILQSSAIDLLSKIIATIM